MHSWNRAYRPNKIADLHLDVVRNKLASFLEVGKIPQVMLFAGPKGTGKTSAARIIGSILNDDQNKSVVIEAYSPSKNKTGSKKQSAGLIEPTELSTLQQKILTGNSFAVQEIDAASNRGIDDIRQLKERVMLPPQEGSVALYILDEAHMLTTEAFNALLKLLEEPPSHAAFILATTELHKIPPTIVSRCHVVYFQKASQPELINTLKRVLASENIPFEIEALELIASRADGSFRDAIKMLEHVAQTGAVSQDRVRQLSLGTYQTEIEDLISALLAKDSPAIVAQFEAIRSLSVDGSFFYKALLEHLHGLLLQKLGLRDGESPYEQAIIEFLLREFSEPSVTANSPIAHLPLELKMLEIISRSQKNKSGGSTGGKSASKQTNLPEPTMSPVINLKSDVIQSNSINRNPGNGQNVCEQWETLVSLVADKNATVAALLRSAKPVEGKIGEVIVTVYYTFHQEQLMQPKLQHLLAEQAYALAGGHLTFTFILTKNTEESVLLTTPDTQTLSAVVSDMLM